MSEQPKWDREWEVEKLGNSLWDAKESKQRQARAIADYMGAAIKAAMAGGWMVNYDFNVAGDKVTLAGVDAAPAAKPLPAPSLPPVGSLWTHPKNGNGVIKSHDGGYFGVYWSKLGNCSYSADDWAYMKTMPAPSMPPDGSLWRHPKLGNGVVWKRDPKVCLAWAQGDGLTYSAYTAAEFAALGATPVPVYADAAELIAAGLEAADEHDIDVWLDGDRPMACFPSDGVPFHATTDNIRAAIAAKGGAK